MFEKKVKLIALKRSVVFYKLQANFFKRNQYKMKLVPCKLHLY